jgi:nitroreductase
MDVKEAIRERRSIRAYTREPVPDDHLRQVVRAGMQAPSAGNLQSRRFYVVANAKRRRELAAAALNQGFIHEAPLAIVVCADHRIRREYGERGVELYCLLDCAAATQNMMLCAYALGLGTCWVGAFDEAKVAGLLDLPSHLRPVVIFPVGYPAERPEPGPRIRFDTACKVV